MSDDNLTLEQAVKEIEGLSFRLAHNYAMGDDPRRYERAVSLVDLLGVLARLRVQPPAGVGEIAEEMEQLADRMRRDFERTNHPAFGGAWALAQEFLVFASRLRACEGGQDADCDSCCYKHPEIEGVARACPHVSASGVDQSTGPDKRWRCDGCGWEHYVWDRPDGISEHISPAVHDQVAALEAENGRLRGVIESKHGGEPAELLRELDAEREAHDQTRARIKALEEGLGDAVFKTTDLEARQRWLRRHDGGKGGGHE